MTYIKRQPDILFTGTEMFQGNKVLVSDESGLILDVIPAEDAGEGVRRISGLLCPGFINTHCHLELSHMKNLISRRMGMTGFIREIVTRRFAEEQLIHEAISGAEDEMIRNGIVAVGDICNTSHTISQKSQNNLYYHNFIEEFGLDDKIAEKRFEAAVFLKNRFEQAGTGLTSIVPHAPYSVSPKLFNLIAECSRQQIISIHNQESPEEDEFIEFGRGLFFELFQAAGTLPANITARGSRSLPYILRWLRKASAVLLVHNVCTRESDLQQLNQQELDRFYWCLCPNANLYITGQLPDIGILKKYSSKLILGTDSLASNHSLSIADEIKTLHTHFPQIEVSELLRWATINGAEALGIGKVYGSFEKGKRPGMVLLDPVNFSIKNLKASTLDA